jgi:hypothetical protein
VRKRAGAGDAAGYEARRLELELAAYDDLTASAQIDLQARAGELGVVVGDDEAVDAAGELPVPAGAGARRAARGPLRPSRRLPGRQAAPGRGRRRPSGGRIAPGCRACP